MEFEKRLTVRVHTRSAKPRVAEEDGIFHVYVASAPEKGKANKDVVKALAKHLGVSRSEVTIASGHASRDKIIRISSAD